MSDIPDLPAAPEKRIVVLDEGAIDSTALSAIVERVDHVDLIGAARDSATPAVITDVGLTVTERSDAGTSIGDAIRFAASQGVGVVVTGMPEHAEQWMLSALGGIAEAVGRSQPIPTVHVLSSGGTPSGPILLASTTGEVAAADIQAAVDYAHLLERDVELVVPMQSEPDPGAQAAVDAANDQGVRLTRIAVDEPETNVVVRAASISAVVLSVLDVAGSLEPGSEPKKKLVREGQPKEVIDALTATPPHDIIIFFHGRRMIDGPDEHDEDEETSDLTDGDVRVP